MGVYVFRSRYVGSWVKVGHHRVTERRPNVYYRIVPRGFYSCVRPQALGDRVGMCDVALIAWYPDLHEKDEKRIHSILRSEFQHVGEWFMADPRAVTEVIERCGAIASHPKRQDVEQVIQSRNLAMDLVDSIFK